MTGVATSLNTLQGDFESGLRFYEVLDDYRTYLKEINNEDGTFKAKKQEIENILNDYKGY